jgi:23S rRNA (uracil1939-C5)-methyltransferase
LLEALVGGAQRRQVTSFLDLYAGAGNFTLPLLAKGMRGVSVESTREAAHAAREAARRQNLTNGRFWARDVRRAVESLAAEGRRYDLVIVDPPRAGVKHGLSEMAALSQGWVALCSCNPVTLARDLKVLLDEGYAVEDISAFDMFPQTHHWEALVWLRVPPRQRPLLA